MPTVDDSASVVVPHIQCPLSDSTHDELRQSIDPLTDDGNYGIEVYRAVVEFILRHQQ